MGEGRDAGCSRRRGCRGGAWAEEGEGPAGFRQGREGGGGTPKADGGQEGGTVAPTLRPLLPYLSPPTHILPRVLEAETDLRFFKHKVQTQKRHANRYTAFHSMNLSLGWRIRERMSKTSSWTEN